MGIKIFEPNVIRNQSERQLISFFLIAYNQELFIREALEGAFSQTYQPLEIVLSDDNSTDRTYEIMLQMATEYRGPHRIILNRNEQNLGLCGNVNRILDLTSGEIIVVAGGDDISFPERVEKSWQILKDNPDVNCVSFQLQTINAEGNLVTKQACADAWLKKYSLADFNAQKGFHINGPSRAFRRNVYEYFGPLARQSQTDDSTILLRCLMMGMVSLSGDIGIYYRIHGDNYYASDKKHSIRYQNIYQQYLDDILVALHGGIISPADAERLKKVLWKRIEANILRAGYFNAGSKFLYFFTHILFSNVFRVKVKMKYFLQIMRLWFWDTQKKKQN